MPGCVRVGGAIAIWEMPKKGLRFFPWGFPYLLTYILTYLLTYLICQDPLLGLNWEVVYQVIQPNQIQ